jgi:hypothetical protein
MQQSTATSIAHVSSPTLPSASSWSLSKPEPIILPGKSRLLVVESCTYFSICWVHFLGTKAQIGRVQCDAGSFIAGPKYSVPEHSVNPVVLYRSLTTRVTLTAVMVFAHVRRKPVTSDQVFVFFSSPRSIFKITVSHKFLLVLGTTSRTFFFSY